MPIFFEQDSFHYFSSSLPHANILNYLNLLLLNHFTENILIKFTNIFKPIHICQSLNQCIFVSSFFINFFFSPFRATPVAYGSFWARGQTGLLLPEYVTATPDPSDSLWQHQMDP